jgi:plasmid stabilization system protein ParE
VKTEFLPEADEEFREAVHYYESEAPGVGMAFAVAVHKAVVGVAEFPLAVPQIRAGIRKKVLRHFPYNVLYSVESDTLLIVAVAHQKRRPNYWRSRLKKPSNPAH